MESLNIPITNYEKQKFHKLPPWSNVNFFSDTSLSSYTKVNTSNEIFKKLAQEKFEKYINFKKIFTDGSKCEEKVSWAIFSEESSASGRLNNNSSVITAELMAILRAILTIRYSKYSKFVICSDSLSAILALNNIYSRNSLVIKIHDALQSMQIKVVFLWIPGHSGIRGNEIADKMAKEALSLEIPKNSRLFSNDLKNFVKKQIWYQRNEKWKIDGRNTKLFNFKNDIIPWKEIFYLNRKDSIIISRLRIGHTRLTHQHLLEKGKLQPLCNCGDILTVIHIIQECPCYNLARQKFGIAHIGDLGKDDVIKMDGILNFVKEIGIYNEI